MRINLLFFFILLVGLTFSTSCYSPHYTPPNLTVQDSLNQGCTAVDRFAIVGNDLYLASGSTIAGYNIQSLTSPVLIGNVNMIDKTLLIKSLADSFLVVGLTNGEELYQIAKSYLLQNSIPIPGTLFYDPIIYKSNYLYILDGFTQISYNGYLAPNGLILYNEKQFASTVVSTQKNFYRPTDLAIDSSNNLFVCDSGLKVFDASVDTNISLKKHFNIEANKITAYNDNLFILGSTGLYQYKFASDTISLLSKINIIPTP